MKIKNINKIMFSLALLSLFSFMATAETKIGPMVTLSETNEGFVTETRFNIDVDGETIPAILWTPQGSDGTRPLVVFGHGGRQHKRVDNILRSARDLVITEHYAVLAIDGPGHGERASNSTEGASVRGGNTNMTAETMAAITTVQKLGNVGEGPVGYWGVSMGTRFGVPLVAEDQRIKAAILGLFGLFDEGLTADSEFGQAAKKISVPLIFVYQRSDQLMELQNGIDLFDAFGSVDKAMHINPGGHTGIPVSEREKWKPFFVEHLGKAKLN